MTLAQAIRVHALSPLGGRTLLGPKRADVCSALYAHRRHGDWSPALTPTERRMFCLFVALAIESNEE